MKALTCLALLLAAFVVFAFVLDGWDYAYYAVTGRHAPNFADNPVMYRLLKDVDSDTLATHPKK